MTDQNYTHIAVILDRSGSMSSIREDMEGGFNRFIEDQKKVSGKCTISLYQFDTEYETVYELVDIQQAAPLSLVPRSMTALLDATGRTIDRVGNQLTEMEEWERPGKVVLVIITDGMENASKEYTLDRIKEMVQHQQEKYSWQIVFLGANIDAFKAGYSMGYSPASTITFAANDAGVFNVYNALSEKLEGFRLGQYDTVCFDADDRKAQREAGATQDSRNK